MAFIAITFPEFKNSLKWRTEALRRLNNEIDIQVYSDGQQCELSMGYHLGCIRWFIRTYELAKLNGHEDAFPSSYLEKIEKMSEVPMKLCLPDGTNVQFGDSDEDGFGGHTPLFHTTVTFIAEDSSKASYLIEHGANPNHRCSIRKQLKYTGKRHETDINDI
jgi:heparan-sulfate lyase